MREFNKQVMMNEYSKRNDELNKHLKNLEAIIVNSGEPLEGNSFYIHLSLNFGDFLYNKQLNLFWTSVLFTKKRICEIGFNAGHSTMLMLLGLSPLVKIDFTIFDIGDHKYTVPCLEYIINNFGNTNFEYIEGDSIVTMPEWIANNQNTKFDLIHVDGGHSLECIINDMKNSDSVLAINGVLIVDDTNIYYINDTVNSYLNTGNYVELDVLGTEGYPHRIIQKIK